MKKTAKYSLFILIFLISNAILINSAYAVMPVPAGQQDFLYPAIESPLLSDDPSQAKPIGVGSVATGGDTLSLQVGLNQFSGPVDIYLAIAAPAIVPDIYMIQSDLSLQPISVVGLVPWMANTTGPIDIDLFGNITGLPAAKYDLYLAIAPAGSLDTFYLWTTSFVIGNYFLLDVGNKWTYSSFVDGKYRNDEIIGTEIINGTTTYIKERIEPDPDNYHEKRWLAYDGSSVLMFRLWGNEGAEPAIDFSPPVIVNKPSPQVGEQWSFEIPNFGTVSSEVLSVNDTVTVPAGTFTNCIKVKTTESFSGKIHLYHYAQEIGMVRYELIDKWAEELVYAKIGAKTYGTAP